jgi:hydroxymethylbilane synthase
MTTVRVATRGSDLALAQANAMAERIRNELGRSAELVVLRTTGDRIQDQSLAKIGGKGLFVKEIEEALLDGRADVAVHSAKDLPAVIAPGCVLAAFPERADPRDALVAHAAETTLDRLPERARVGTGSTRRTAQLRALRPDLEVVPLRGNVPTRIQKIETEDLHAVVLACAGLDRLGLAEHVRERVSSEAMLPAVCQGTLALETRADDPLRDAIHQLEDSLAAASARAERAFLNRIGGDCTTPIAAFAEVTEAGGLRMRSLVASEDGRNLVRAEGSGRDPESLGQEVAEELLDAGGREILAALAGS